MLALPRLLLACRYKKMEIDDRAQQLQQIAFQLDVLEGIVAGSGGPFVAGAMPVAAVDCRRGCRPAPEGRATELVAAGPLSLWQHVMGAGACKVKAEAGPR